jgi:hypothetical protein
MTSAENVDIDLSQSAAEDLADGVQVVVPINITVITRAISMMRKRSRTRILGQGRSKR